MEYTSLQHLMEEHGFKSIEELGRHYYDETDCGVGVQLKMFDGSYASSNDEIIPSNVCGLQFTTIVEGSDAEFSGDTLIFGGEKNPVTDENIQESLKYLEGLVDEYLVEEEEDIDVDFLIEEEEVEDDDEWVYGEVIPFRSDYFDEENIEY